jgi:hypothetical protein
VDPSLVLPQLLVRGNATQSISSSSNLERLSSGSALEHYRFCRSLLNEARHTIAEPAFSRGFGAACRCPAAKRYQPSMAALRVLSHILGNPADSIGAHLFLSCAPTGDREGIDQGSRLLPLPIVRELVQLWKEIGSFQNDELLIKMANDASQWANQWGNRLDYLFYRENEFDENEIHEEVPDPETGFGRDDFLGMARLSNPSFDAALTLSGWNTGLGVLRFGEVEIRAMGPQGFPLSDPSGFGLAQIGVCHPVIEINQEQLFLKGWSRCFRDKEIWLSVQASATSQMVDMDVRWVGINSCSLLEKSAAAHWAMVFYVKASACSLEDGSVLHPKDLRRYQGKSRKIVFDQVLQIDCSTVLNLQIIPLAGSGCFWNTTFLIAFEFNASLDAASFKFVRI